jgi:hypothetical protein
MAKLHLDPMQTHWKEARPRRDWGANANQVVLGQVKVDDQNNEITAILALQYKLNIERDFRLD